MSGKEKGTDEKPEVSDWKDALGYFAMRVCDSAYLPWSLVALFCLGIVWVLTRNLESKDALAFL